MNEDFFDSPSYWDYILPALSVFSIWCGFIIVVLLAYIFTTESSDWVKIYDKCSRRGVYYRYVIRIITGHTIKNFDPYMTTFRMEIVGPRNYKITAFGIKPHVLRKALPFSADKSIIRFLLLRKTPLNNIVKVILNHNGRGAVFVTRVEIQEVASQMANIAYVDHYIEKNKMNEAKLKQAFPAAAKEPKEMEFEDPPQKLLNFMEFVIFLWLTINLIPLFCILLILCFERQQNESEMSFSLICKSYQNDIMSSLMTAVVASSLSAGLSAALAVIFRFSIKERIIDSLCFECLQVFYLTVLVIMATSAGLGSVVLAILRFRINVTTEYVFWMFAVGIAYLILTVIWIPVLYLLGRIIGFFDTSEIQERTLKPDSEKSSASGPSTNPFPPKDKESESAKTAVPDTNPKTSKEKPSKEKVDKVESQESIGNKYYAQLMKNKTKVKSISKY